MNIKSLPIGERPRERLIKYGKDNLSNLELLTIILKSGTKERSVNEMALDILSTLDKISDLRNITITKLLEIKGIGMAKALELISIIELGKRIFLENDTKNKKILNNPELIFEDSKYLFYNKKQEYFYCLYFNNKKELIERKLLFMGTINRSLVHPREIFKEAYLLSASYIVCMHNHPSGDVRPSHEDIRLTKALVEIGTLQSIPIVDHIIISDNNYYSFHQNNLMGGIEWKKILESIFL